MNRFFHSWVCNACGKLGYIEIFEMLTALPEHTTCDACGSKNLTKMSNHLNDEPTQAHLQMVRRAIKGDLRHK